jgi:L-ascorbate metabolism protein UlaG (beta-lactamase superfamily)
MLLLALYKIMLGNLKKGYVMNKIGAWVVGVTAAAAVVCLSAPAMAQLAYLQKSNANHMKQLAETQCSDGGGVTLDYYGFMAFLITSPCGMRGMFDPWRDAQPGLYDAKSGGTTGWDKVTWMEHKFPRLLTDPKHSMVDYAVSTHSHFDHDGIYQFDSATVLDRLVGQWQFADVKITGLSDIHACGTKGIWPWGPTAIAWIGEPTCHSDPNNAPGEDDNNVYYIEIGKSEKDKINIVHWGDNHFQLLPQNVEFFKTHPVDVAIIPVEDSGHIVGPDQVAQIVRDIKPKVIIPSHYFIKGIVNPSYTVLTPDKWFASQKHKLLTGSAQFKLTRSWLDSLKFPEGEFLAMYFEDHVSFPVIDIPQGREEKLKESQDTLANLKSKN